MLFLLFLFHTAAAALAWGRRRHQPPARFVLLARRILSVPQIPSHARDLQLGTGNAEGRQLLIPSRRVWGRKSVFGQSVISPGLPEHPKDLVLGEPSLAQAANPDWQSCAGTGSRWKCLEQGMGTALRAPGVSGRRSQGGIFGVYSGIPVGLSQLSLWFCAVGRSELRFHGGFSLLRDGDGSC